MYQFEGRIRYSEVDEDCKLTIANLIDYFQDCSTIQSEDLGVGIDYLREKNVGWVIVSYHVVVEQMPKLGDRIYSQTWPNKITGAFGYRNFAIADMDGKRMAYASSLWILMDLKTGKPIRIPEEISANYEPEPAIEMNDRRRKIRLPKEVTVDKPVVVSPFFLDSNHHVNNGKYLMVAMGYLPQDLQIRDFYIEYRDQAHLGDLLYPKYGWVDGNFVIALCAEDDRVYCAMEFIGEHAKH